MSAPASFGFGLVVSSEVLSSAPASFGFGLVVSSEVLSSAPASFGFGLVASKDFSMKNPKWSRDELILALDFYLDHYPSLPDKNTVELQELSRILNQLMNKLGHTGDSKYRNPNGVYMKLMNFLYILVKV
jgi:hypothetical protein